MINEISPIIISAINVLKKANNGLIIDIIGEKMIRSAPSEHFPAGQLGIKIKMTMLEIEKNVFLNYQFCEDMLFMPHLAESLAFDFVLSIYREDFIRYINENTL